VADYEDRWQQKIENWDEGRDDSDPLGRSSFSARQKRKDPALRPGSVITEST
jgi:hypothetical protein